MNNKYPCHCGHKKSYHNYLKWAKNSRCKVLSCDCKEYRPNSELESLINLPSPKEVEDKIKNELR